MAVGIEIKLQVTSYKEKYPKLKVYNNSELLDDVVCVDEITVLTYTTHPQKTNVLKLEHYNKSFGDNRIWDSGPGGELKLKVLDIKFNGVSIGHLLTTIYFTTIWSTRQIELESSEFLDQYSKFISDGHMVFNGFLEYQWDMPIYDFLIEQKFKEAHNLSVAFHSNNTELFHYESGKLLIDEIKSTIEQHEN